MEDLTSQGENEVIEISEEEQKQFDQAVETCSTKEGRLKTIKHVFDVFSKEEHTKMTIFRVLNLVCHPCIGKIEVPEEEVITKVEELKNEIIEADPEWWKMASKEDEESEE